MTINVNIANSAFLFIDVQEKLVAMLKKNTCEQKAQILAKLANTLGIKCVVTEQYPKGLGATVPSVKENLPSSNTVVFEKTDFNALEVEGLIQELGNYDNIFVFGIETHICVFQSVCALLRKNFDVFVVKDACASRETEEFKTAISLMEREGAKIITTEMVLFEMLKSAKHPNFKELQALIK